MVGSHGDSMGFPANPYKIDVLHGGQTFATRLSAFTHPYLALENGQTEKANVFKPIEVSLTREASMLPRVKRKRLT